ncbi:MAG: hypothetical protein HQL17_04230 [Candidatus Omnitrophica bacterium]|nr:hypothetical protein [Candidatus Omnitrophota bacterium]
MKKTLRLAIALLMIFSPFCVAQTPEEYYKTLINTFDQAFNDKNEQATTLAWDQLNADPQAKEYMNANYPVTASNFRSTQTVIESTQALQKFDRNYPQPIQFPQMPQRPAFYSKPTNQDAVATHPNNLQPSVQETHAQRLNAPLPDNQTKAANQPNQNMPSNQDYIQGQVNRMNQTEQ